MYHLRIKIPRRQFGRQVQTAQLIREDKPILFCYLETRNLRYIHLTLKYKLFVIWCIDTSFRHTRTI